MTAKEQVCWNQSQLVATLWLPQPWSPLTAQIVCAAPLVPSRGIKRCETMFNGSQNALRMRIQFLEPSTTVLHLARASRGAAHTICAVNGDEGPGSHNSGCQMGLGVT